MSQTDTHSLKTAAGGGGAEPGNRLREELWGVAIQHLESCRDYYWLQVDSDWRILAANDIYREELLRGDAGPTVDFLETVSPGVADDLQTLARDDELRGSEREIVHSLPGGARTIHYKFYSAPGGGWLLFGRDQSQQIELVSQMSVLLEDMEGEMQRERQLAERLRSLLSNDHLTGLANRRHFESVLQSRWESYIASEQFFSIISIDIDHFKTVNDRYGHALGDEVLKRVARVLEACVRAGDLAARVGGEEFLLIVANARLEDAKRIAERVRRRMEVSPMPQGVGRVTVSLGVASTESGAAESAERLLAWADAALYAAKEKGRNRVDVAEGK